MPHVTLGWNSHRHSRRDGRGRPGCGPTNLPLHRDRPYRRRRIGIVYKAQDDSTGVVLVKENRSDDQHHPVASRHPSSAEKLGTPATSLATPASSFWRAKKTKENEKTAKSRLDCSNSSSARGVISEVRSATV